ncbi:Uncharacterised protein [Vibrio cholerae]|nr:Uncharacterised protein [Vibrio cholerae]
MGTFTYDSLMQTLSCSNARLDRPPLPLFPPSALCADSAVHRNGDDWRDHPWSWRFSGVQPRRASRSATVWWFQS